MLIMTYGGQKEPIPDDTAHTCGHFAASDLLSSFNESDISINKLKQ